MRKVFVPIYQCVRKIFSNNFFRHIPQKIKTNPSLNSIQQFSEEELIRELGTRHDNFVFAGEKILDASGDDVKHKQNIRPRLYYIGDRTVCAGLSMAVAKMALDDDWGISADNIIY